MLVEVRLNQAQIFLKRQLMFLILTKILQKTPWGSYMNLLKESNFLVKELLLILMKKFRTNLIGLEMSIGYLLKGALK